MNSQAYVLDTFAWVEYFRGSSLAKKVESILQSGKCFTPSVVIAELKTKFLRENLDFTQAFNFIEFKTTIIPLDKRIALIAGKINFERKKINHHWSLSDSVVLATARKINAKVVTGDEDFSDLKEEVVMLK
jgi:predicted nucleic acid-binding protein